MATFTVSDPSIKKLVEVSKELKNIGSALALLSWDQETYLAPQGALARANQLQTLSGIYHQKATHKELETAIDNARAAVEKNPTNYASADHALIKEMQRDFDLATKLPQELVEQLSKESSLGLESWKRARDKNSFSSFAPNLEKMITLKRRVAECIGYTDSPYDALLDEYEQGLTKKEVEESFVSLREFLTTAIPSISEKTKVYDTGVLKKTYDHKKLWDFSMHILTFIGFDLKRGRQDLSAHPFTMGVTSTDVRLTTRILENNPISTLMSTIHEAGHGMYEQGISPDIEETTIGYANSLVLHESQSRFWENMIGKSFAFWEFLYPQFQAVFPEHLSKVSLEAAYRELNVVAPSLIRVDADEVTYHMHIIIRTEIEAALIEGKLAVNDVPKRWKELYHDYLGVDVPNQSVGSLQDIHWAQGLIGYFPTYSLGSILSAQLYASIERDHPDIQDMVRLGRFEKPLKWMREKVHVHGRMLSSKEIIQNSTGESLSSKAYENYVANKFGDSF